MSKPYVGTAKKVSVGLATQTGIVGALGAFALAVIAFIEGDMSEEAVGALVSGAVILYGTIRGRMDQAKAMIENEAMTPIRPAGTTYAGETRVP